MAAMDSPISIRVSADADDRPFPDLTGPVLLAEDDGHPVAAIDLESGNVVTDPRRATSGLVALLQLHRLEVRLIGALVGG
jgi:hypothetical protein